ncbi:hypothetical protein GOBAR_AA31985 [Gossypium barbadense]|uniref:Uncharacterized protein n=1 Tax=Gossypium barbadense TaxID=3634 RepID=A0A2P5WC87_GOSBA|nr:hypothetical protein GOBAR_AA31985 [Gossypium barbadense]
MLTKFISVLETSFQNTEVALKDQQASMQGLENQIGELAKLISKRQQGDDTITLQARDSVKTFSDRDDYTSYVNMSNLVTQTSLQETPQKNVMEPHSSPYDRKKMTHEERMLQIDELDEWRAHVNEKPRIHDAEPKRCHDEHVDALNQFKVGDKVLLDKTDP